MNTFKDSYGQLWHEVIALPIEKDLSELSSLLYQQRVEHRISENNGRQIVWVRDPELIPQLQEFVQQWRDGEVNIVRTETVDKPSEYGTSLKDDNTDTPLNTLIGTESFFTQLLSTPVTAILLVLCFIGSLIVGLNINALDYSFLTYTDVNGFRAVIDHTPVFPFSQPWRFITPIFLHFGIMHILGNALFLWYFGARLEKVFGTFIYILFVVVVGVVSNSAQYAWELSGNFGGFSGVNYAFVGYILIRQQMKPNPRLNVPSGLIWFPVVTMVIGMFGGVDFLVGGSVANTAHATGFVLGITWAFITCFSVLKK